MSKRTVYCVVCGGNLAIRTIMEDNEGVETIDGFTCDSCGVHYDKVPSASAVTQSQWESKIVGQVGGMDV